MVCDTCASSHRPARAPSRQHPGIQVSRYPGISHPGSRGVPNPALPGSSDRSLFSGRPSGPLPLRGSRVLPDPLPLSRRRSAALHSVVLGPVRTRTGPLCGICAQERLCRGVPCAQITGLTRPSASARIRGWRSGSRSRPAHSAAPEEPELATGRRGHFDPLPLGSKGLVWPLLDLRSSGRSPPFASPGPSLPNVVGGLVEVPLPLGTSSPRLSAASRPLLGTSSDLPRCGLRPQRASRNRYLSQGLRPCRFLTEPTPQW